MSERNGDQEGLFTPGKVLSSSAWNSSASPPLLVLSLLAELGNEINTDLRDLVVLWMIHFSQFSVQGFKSEKSFRILRVLLKIVKMDGISIAPVWWAYFKALGIYSNLNLVLCHFSEFCALGG